MCHSLIPILVPTTGYCATPDKSNANCNPPTSTTLFAPVALTVLYLC